jgi:hypothetical protein
MGLSGFCHVSAEKIANFSSFQKPDFAVANAVQINPCISASNGWIGGKAASQLSHRNGKIVPIADIALSEVLIWPSRTDCFNS